MNKLITIGIPAYNRAKELGLLLDSIAGQWRNDIEILVIEDKSPEREKIREVVERNKLPIVYIENDVNLGYDGNLRKIINSSKGEYILFMGNDDLLLEDALDYYRSIIEKYSDDGLSFIVRAYQEYDNKNQCAARIIRYVRKDMLLNPSEENAAFVFRRSVAIMGMCYRTSLIKKLDTAKYDGSIYYQLWLSGNLALKNKILVSSKVTALRRFGLEPDFGNADAEKKSVVGHYYSSEAFVNYVSNMIKIARDVAALNDSDLFYKLVINDFRRYSYPFLAPVRSNGIVEFLKHYNRMRKTGVGVGIIFNIYFIMLLICGRRFSEWILINVARKLPTTAIFWRVRLDEAES